MAGEVNYGLVNPAVLDYSGQEQKSLNVQKSRLDVQRLEEERQQMLGLQKKLADSGQNPDLNLIFDTLIKSGNPDYMAKGAEGKLKLKEQQNYEAVRSKYAPGGGGGGDIPAPTAPGSYGAPMTPTTTNAPAPRNALVPMVGARQAAPNVNALAPAVDETARLQAQIDDYSNLGTAQGFKMAEMLQKRLTALEPTSAIKEFNYGLKNPEFTNYQMKKAKAGATTLSMGGQPEFIKGVGKNLSEDFTKEFTATSNSAQSAAENLPKLYETLNLINNSDAITGIGSDVLKNVERVKKQFLADKNAGKKVSDTEVLDAMLGSDVFPMIQSLGVGARGMDTPAEREFLRGVMTGTTALDKDTLKRMTEIRVNLAKRAIQKYNQNVDSGKYKPVESAQGSALPRINTPEFTGGLTPIYATNGTQRIVSTDGGVNWKPVGAK
jgi:hypothetical protein